MTVKEIIDGLKFTVEMFLFNPSTGETFTEPRNDMDKTTIDACKGAIELLEQTRDEKTIDAIDFAIKATNSQDDYSMGMRNGMRYVKSLIDGKEPQYELRRTDEEIKLGIDLGDEVVSERTNRPCEYDEERIDVNAIIISELEKIKEEMEEIKSGCIGGIDYFDIIDDHISELKGETE